MLNHVNILFEHICCSLEELLEFTWFKDTLKHFKPAYSLDKWRKLKKQTEIKPIASLNGCQEMKLPQNKFWSVK